MERGNGNSLFAKIIQCSGGEEEAFKLAGEPAGGEGADGGEGEEGAAGQEDENFARVVFLAVCSIVDAFPSIKQ